MGDVFKLFLLSGVVNSSDDWYASDVVLLSEEVDLLANLEGNFTAWDEDDAENSSRVSEQFVENWECKGCCFT
jgi:hypothetical protein